MHFLPQRGSHKEGLGMNIGSQKRGKGVLLPEEWSSRTPVSGYHLLEESGYYGYISIVVLY